MNIMEPQPSFNSTPPTQPTQMPASTPQKPSNKKRMWFIIGGLIVVALIVVAVIMVFQSNQKQTGGGLFSNVKTNQPYTVGAHPYIEACSVVTEAAFRQAFTLTGDPKLGGVISSVALPQLNFTNDTDATKVAPGTDKDATSSDCELTFAPTADAKRMKTVRTELKQYIDAKKAESYLQSQRRFYGAAGAAPTLASFPNSFIKMPSSPGGSVEALLVHNAMIFRMSYLLEENEPADSVPPKFDTLAKQVIASIDNKDVASKSSNPSGHTTALGKPFVDTCYNMKLEDLAKKLSAIEFNPLVTMVGQYGALPGSAAASDGVSSSCSLTYNTTQERKTREQNNSTSQTSATTVSASEKYPHTLVIRTNRYATATEAKNVLASRKARHAAQNTPTTPVTVTDVVGIGDSAYVLQKEVEIPDFSLGGNNKKSLVETNYIVLSGSNIVTIDFQQSKSAKTQPLTIQDTLIKDAFGLFVTLLSK